MEPKQAYQYIHFGIDLGIFICGEIFPQVKLWVDENPGEVIDVPSQDEVLQEYEKLDPLGAGAIAPFLKGIGHNNPFSGPYPDVEAIEYAVAAESGRLQVFAVTEKRWDTKKLLNDVSALFAPGVFSRLGEVTQSDFIDAGKCIAFELPTAAAFHLTRGTEMVLRDFYRAMIGDLPDKVFWANMILELRKTQTPSLKALYDNLYNIKENYRDPTAHPDKLYDIDLAQDLFGLCIAVVNQMVPIILQQHDKRPQ